MNLRNIVLLSTMGIILSLSCMFAGCSITQVDKHEFGYVYNRFNGEIEVLERDGLIFRPWPKYLVQTIDERPYQVSITANTNIGQRVLNAKLVRFDPEGIQEFIAWHGRGAGSTPSDLQEIFKCYAFDKDGGANCPFITVLNEIQASQIPDGPKIQ